MRAYVAKVTIAHSKPPVWRRVVFPSGMTFRKIHEALQVIFGWDGYHMHCFYTSIGEIGDREGRDLFGGVDSDADYDEADVTIDEVGYKFEYVYDFGDDWRHNVVVEKIIDYDENYPQVIKWKGDNYMEDCGGVYFANYRIAELASMKDEEPTDIYEVEEGDEDEEWDEEDDFDEDAVTVPFRLEEVNSELRML